MSEAEEGGDSPLEKLIVEKIDDLIKKMQGFSGSLNNVPSIRQNTGGKKLREKIWILNQILGKMAGDRPKTFFYFVRKCFVFKESPFHLQAKNCWLHWEKTRMVFHKIL